MPRRSTTHPGCESSMMPLRGPARSGAGLFRAVLALSSLVLMAARPAAAQQVVFQATDDTWVDGLSSTTTHGNDLSLGICPVADYWIYLKFDLHGIMDQVGAAELRMTRTSGARPEEISIYLISTDTWTEGGLTGNNRPQPRSPANSEALGVGQFVSAGGYDRWASPALTGAVRAETSGDGILSLMLRENHAGAFDIRYYRSQEAGGAASTRPHLVLTLQPPEVAGLSVLGKAPTMLGWQSAGATASYDIAGGTLAQLTANGGVGAALCLSNDHAGTSWNDARPNPPVGGAYYYIVRAVNSGTAGTYGFATSGAERLPVAACP